MYLKDMTEEQKAELLAKGEEFLKGHPSLDARKKSSVEIPGARDSVKGRRDGDKCRESV